MDRRIIKTKDGSDTLFVPELGEHYHSIHGAVQESEWIYLDAAFRASPKNPVRVLEFGMGTGLNVMLTFLHAAREKREVFYHTIEKYPLTRVEYNMLNFNEMIEELYPGLFIKIHESPWDTCSNLSESFTLFKELKDFRQARPAGPFDVVYYDAFAPEVQPDLWTVEMFRKIFGLASEGAILTTYSAKGMVRRHLKAAGFSVEKLPGPPGKREFVRAHKSAIFL